MRGFSPIEGRASTAGECLAAMREWPLAAHGIAQPVLSDKDQTGARLLAEADI